MEAADWELIEVLGAAQRLGALGDRPIPEVIDHARAFVSALADVSGAVLDLGAGGGVPGFVLAVDRPDLTISLLDRRTKRTDFLTRMVRRLGVESRVVVLATDADDARRQGIGGFDAVVARGFGPPQDTLRTAVGFVRPGGVIVISEPPVGDRWDPELVDALGLEREPSDPRVVRFRRR